MEQKSIGVIMKVGDVVKGIRWRNGEVGVILNTRRGSNMVWVKAICPVNGIVEIEMSKCQLEVI